MPVIGVPVDDLRARIGENLDNEALLELLGDMGCDVEGYATLRRAQCNHCSFIMELAGQEEVPPECGQCHRELRAQSDAVRNLDEIEVVRMELLAVRPDMFDPAGLARAIRGLLGSEVGPKEYPVGETIATVTVGDLVRAEKSLRPHIACAVIENIELDDDSIKVLMKLQENLHWALGRNRKHASIGVYDFDSLGGETRFEYTAESPDYAFRPLGALDGSAPVDLDSILESHPKGKAYKHLLEGFDRYPILRSEGGRVLSMPPVINSEETRVDKSTTRFFIDVTGSGRRIVERTLNILVTSLLEYHPAARLRGVTIENATGANGVDHARESWTSPDLASQSMAVSAAETGRIIGIDCSERSLSELLRKMRHGVKAGADGTVNVDIPAYRNDILHPRDLMEDAAIAFGYRNIKPTLVPTLTVGKELESTRAADRMREILIGLGYLEIFTLALISEELAADQFGCLPHPRRVLLENPISGEQTELRTSLLPMILQTFARNRHNSLPQRICEVGEVTFLEEGVGTGAGEHPYAALGAVAPKIGFAEIRAQVESIYRELDRPFKLVPASEPFLIPGRGASVVSEDGAKLGIFGEVHPAVLERFGLQNPVVLWEGIVPGLRPEQAYDSWTR